jgi:hypothetical protein
MDSDNSLSVTDTSLFSDFYLAGDPRADVNRDCLVNASDIGRFFESYSCGCTP